MRLLIHDNSGLGLELELGLGLGLELGLGLGLELGLGLGTGHSGTDVEPPAPVLVASQRLVEASLRTCAETGHAMPAIPRVRGMVTRRVRGMGRVRGM